MNSVIIQVIRVAAHHGLRRQRRVGHLWAHVHTLTSMLGHPPAPGPR